MSSAISAAYYAMKEALKDRDYERYTRQDYLFHLSIIIASQNDIFIQVINIFKNQYYKYFKELNRFMFEYKETSAALVINTESSYDTHTLLFEALTGKTQGKAEELVETFTSGNKKRFATYLRSRAASCPF